MEAQRARARARAAQSFKANAQLPYDGQDTEFKGYSERQTESKVLALYKDGGQVVELNEGDSGRRRYRLYPVLCRIRRPSRRRRLYLRRRKPL